MNRTLHPCLERFPGAALELSPEGIVLGSNGRLDTLVGRDLVGVDLAEVLDPTSQAKWRRILDERQGGSPACTWELVFATPASLELRIFLAVRGGTGAEAVLWLLEYSTDPKMEQLYAELSEMHRELVEAQRQLGRERRRLARALETAEAAIRSRDDVLAIVSHDLRNPVSTITMAAGLLEMDFPEERRTEQVAIIKRSAMRMNRLISDLLDVSAVESGQFAVEPESTALAPILEDTCRSLAERADRKGLRLECEPGSGVPMVLADRYRVQQVLDNLVGNAIKFAPPESVVTVRAVTSGPEVIVSVEDAGPGISATDLSQIFDRFWHASRRKKGGAGLGLAISKGIVEAHGGRIWVESAPGQGSTFYFSLPALPRETA